ncbi:hypothetical protein [Nocardioides sp. Arc9.136]|uniref:hypothetical protein n=1 Tax=Nocardioides sp. Arc9.136 TaxID=2996826 RepID=UPI00266627B1|nr:hypothetical protein [Nocardioides sp. Arc9.136]WKN50080.1 hypothetical protein OSR43_08135 [Nocardioides sp. Arc9.136]
MSTTSSAASQIRHRVPRLAEAAVERARLTVVPRRRVRAARVPFVTLVSLVLLGGVVGLLLFNTQMQQASFAATALEQQAGNLAAREQTLTMEIERLRDPQTIAARATKLGMVVAPAPAFLDLDTGAVEGTPAPAGDGTSLRIRPRPPVLPPSLDPTPTVVTDLRPGAVPPEGVLPEDRNSGDTGRGDGQGRGDGGRTSQESQQSQGSQGQPDQQDRQQDRQQNRR